MPGSRAWTFTLNNWTTENTLVIDGLVAARKAQYVIYGKEVGESGTPHLQGYLEFKEGTELGAVKNKLKCSHVHVEPRYSTQENAIEYCKKDGDWIEFGIAKEQGKRTDLTQLANGVKEGKTLREIAEENPENWIKYHKGITSLRGMMTEPRDHSTPKNIIVRVGPTGTGKSRIAIEEFPDAYLWGSENGKWWDKYDAHDTVIMDEFRGQLPYAYLLRLLDRYKMQVEVKGGMMEFVPDTIIITSPIHPSQWYNPQNMKAADKIGQLKRRISEIWQHKQGDETGREAIDITDATWPEYEDMGTVVPPDSILHFLQPPTVEYKEPEVLQPPEPALVFNEDGSYNFTLPPPPSCFTFTS